MGDLHRRNGYALPRRDHPSTSLALGRLPAGHTPAGADDVRGVTGWRNAEGVLIVAVGIVGGGCIEAGHPRRDPVPAPVPYAAPASPVRMAAAVAEPERPSRETGVEATAGSSTAAARPVFDAAEHELGAPSQSRRLDGGLFSPMPGGIVGGYPADTGLDIAGFRLPVYALASGTLIYSEKGHTRWSTDDNAVLLRLDEPIAAPPTGDGEPRWVTHVWYAHLSQLRYRQSGDARRPQRVEGGALLGISGIANRSPHLHLGLLLDGVTDQRAGSYLRDDECRALLGALRRGQRLPALDEP